MTRSLAAVFSGVPGQLTFQQIKTPTPRRGEVLVRVLGCTLCGSDLHSFEGRRTVSTPTILGHEIVGEIVAFGEDAPTHDVAGTPISIGSRVTWAIVANCSKCYFCKRDLPQKCLHAVKYGHESFRPGEELLGGVAEHCLLVRGVSIVAVPESLSLAVACPASCATATVVAALDAAGECAGKSVCVLGAGMLGLTACAMARRRGAARVVSVDVKPERCDRSIQFGADTAVTSLDFPSLRSDYDLQHGFDVVLELTGNSQAFNVGWQNVCVGGTLVLIGAVFPTEPFQLSMEQIVRRHLTLKGVHNYAPKHLVRALRFLEQTQHAHPWEELVSTWMPLQQCQAAFESGRSAKSIRIGVRPNS